MWFLQQALIFSVGGLLMCGSMNAADTATATVTFTIGTINSISVSGNPAALIVSTASAGSQPTSATDTSTTYNLTSNATNQKITGAIDAAMPDGTTLAITLAAPTTGTSAGPVNMSTTAANLVTGISNIAQSNIAITYTVSATVSAAVAGPLMRTVTYTLGP